MSHPIPADSPKAVLAARFGAELRRAIAARGTSLDALGRATGVSDSALDTYVRGANLPRTEKAAVLAETLRWPRLLELVVAARTHRCARPGCPLTFRNDTGSPRRYCSAACCAQAAAMRAATTAARRAAATGDERRRYQEVAQLRSAIRIGDERLVVLSDAVARFCAGCEPEGICHDGDCALRVASPLPLAEGHRSGEAETIERARLRAHSPGADARRSAAMVAKWAEPGYRERLSAANRSRWASVPPEQRAAFGRRISEAKRRNVVPA